MGIDGDPGYPEGITQHYVRCLPSNAGQTDERVKIGRNLTGEVIAQPLTNELNRLRLLPKETRRRDEGLQLLPVSSYIARCIRVGLEQSWCDFVDTLVGALSAQDSGNE